MKKYCFLILILITYTISCQNNPVATEEIPIIIQAYIYLNKPIKDIRIIQPISRSNTDLYTSIKPVCDANVKLIKSNMAYPLSLLNNEGYYYYPEVDLSVQEGDTFQIEVQYGEQIANAFTVVPPPCAIDSVSSDTLWIINIDPDSIHISDQDENYAVYIHWNSKMDKNGAYFPTYVVRDTNGNIITYETLNFTLFRLFDLDNYKSDEYYFYLSNYLYTPKIVDVAEMLFTVYRTTEEYVSYYSYSNSLDTYYGLRPSNMQSGNINNGYGFFTAMSCDSAKLIVKVKSDWNLLTKK